MEIIYLIVGVVAGFIIAYLIFKLKGKSSDNKILEVRSEFGKTQAQLEERVSNLQSEKEKLTSELDQAVNQNEQHLQRLAKAEVEFTTLREKLATQKQEVEELQK
ncbi:MAG: hypothetical protein ABFS16_05840, partial [Bacteroidota bacterium]